MGNEKDQKLAPVRPWFASHQGFISKLKYIPSDNLWLGLGKAETLTLKYGGPEGSMCAISVW